MSDTHNYGTSYVPMATGEFMELGVYYSKGGANAFTGGTDPRGVWLCCWPVKKDGGGTTRQLMDARGLRFKLTETSRRVDRIGHSWKEFVENNRHRIGNAAEAQEWKQVREILDERDP